MILNTHLVIRPDGTDLEATKIADFELTGDADMIMYKIIYNTAAVIAKSEYPDDSDKFEARILELRDKYIPKEGCCRH